MARGKESKYVKSITGREVKLFKQLARTGLTDRGQAKVFCGLNQDRLKKLENSGYIKLSNHCVEGKNIEIIRLDNKGKKICKYELNIESFAYAQTNHLTHDLRLSTTYYSLPSEIQETWEHEMTIIKEIKASYQDKELKTCIDARVKVNGKTIAIEVIGDSYGKAEIEMKREIAIELAGCHSIEYI